MSQNFYTINLKKIVQTNLRLCLMTLSLSTLVLSGVSMITGFNPQFAQAANVVSCPTGETLSGTNCVANAQENKTFATNCPTGFTENYAVCARTTPITCTDPAFKGKTVDAESGWCKFNPTLFDANGVSTNPSNIISSQQIGDADGRYCSTPDGLVTVGGITAPSQVYNFKPFNAKLNNVDTVTTTYICSNNVQQSQQSLAGFRFKALKISGFSDIANYQTVQTGTNYVCPTGYTLIETSKCSKPASTTNCTGGEYVSAGSCVICPVNKYCPANAAVGSNIVICPNGGTLSADKTKCVSPTGFKIASITHTEGCPAGMTKFDQSCAIIETRARDINACSYYFASETDLMVAVADGTNSLSGQSLNVCKIPSTASATQFASGSIVKVSDLQCAGPGSAWYNYNVQLDPLVCGFTAFNPADKFSFRWSAHSFQKFTPLNKLETSTLVCPQGWTQLDTDATLCFQPPVTIVYRGPIDCPAGMTANAGSQNSTDCMGLVCPVGSTITNGVCTIPSTPVREITIPMVPKSTPKPVCISPMGYYTNMNGDCTPCPSGTTTMTSGATSMDQCKPLLVPTIVVTPPAPTPLIRTGGSLSLVAMVSALILAITSLSYLVINKKHAFSSSWTKIK